MHAQLGIKQRKHPRIIEKYLTTRTSDVVHELSVGRVGASCRVVMVVKHKY